MKENLDIIAPKILIDFNSSINTGIFPTNQKLADVSPIFKDENKHFKVNYRPISILPALSKISEKLMSHQIEKYMKDKLSIYQCGFRKGMSAQNCLLFMIENWRKSLDKKGKAGMVLTDLSKAFDCLLTHDLLIAKLSAYGFDYLSLKLVYSYLSDRFQTYKSHALSGISNYMTFKQRQTTMKSFILSQFGYCPLVWMFHSTKLNNRINKIHERAL